MQQKNTNQLRILAAAAAGVWLVVRLVDLLLWTDTATGFVTLGAAGVRYAALAVLAVLCLAAGYTVPDGKPSVRRGAKGIAFLMTGSGVLLTLSGLLSLPAVMSPNGGVIELLNSLMPMLSGVWMMVFGLRAEALPLPDEDLPGAYWVTVPFVGFGWQLLHWFVINPSAVQRVYHTVWVLAYAVALVFLVALAKLFVMPDLTRTRGLVTAGLLAFLLLSASLLPQVVVAFLDGNATLPQLMQGLGMGGFGACGLVCALCCEATAE